MADYHEIVDQIRAFLQASDQTRNERLEGLASAFAGACTEVNQRLGRCHRLLQQGLRSEAIQLAEAEPRLLDAIEALEFPERPEWDDLVGIYDLPAGPRLLAEAGASLGQAYATEQPLQDLMRTHRRLATQRAAVRTRIAVMRKLAAKDADNPIWAEDLRSLEKARLRQIQVEAAEAVRWQDGEHIKRLLAEIQEGAWLDPPPKALIQGLGKADVQLRGQQARAAMADLEARLNEALAAGDPIRGRAARQEWAAVTAAAPPEPADPIWGRVGPALKWLEDEDRAAAVTQAHEVALAALTRALDEPDVYDPAEVERLGQEVLKLGRGMPDGIKRRYNTQLRAVQAARSRRSRILLSAAAVAILLAVGLGVWLIRGRVRSGDADRAAADIARMIEGGELDRAAAFVASLEKADPGLLSQSSLVAVLRSLKTAREQEAVRAGRFQDAMKQAGRASARPGGAKALQEARALARLESEKQAVAQLASRLEAAAEEALEQREAALRPRLDAIGGDVDRIEKQLESSPGDQAGILAMIEAARRAIGELTVEVEQAGEAAQSRARSLGERLDAASARLEGFQRRQTFEDEMTAAVAYSVTGREDAARAFADRLRAYAKAYSGDPRSQALLKRLDELPLWETAEAWNRLVGGWKERGETLSPAEAVRRAEACRAFLERNPRFPGADDLATYRRYLQAIARRASDGGPTARIRRVLSSKLIDGVWIVRVRNPGGGLLAYYTPKPPARDNGWLEISRYARLDERLMSMRVLGTQASVEISPQSKIADQFKPILADGSRMRAWEGVMTELVNAILREPGIDPILQVDLLRMVVKAAGEGSEPFRLAWEPVKGRLEQSRVDVSVAWVDPERDEVNRVRAEAEAVIRSLREAVPKAGEIQAVRDRIERAAGRTYRTVGWIARDGDRYSLRHGGVVPREGELGVIAPSPAGRAEWKKVGSIAGSRPELAPGGGSALAEGRPVFVILGRWL